MMLELALPLLLSLPLPVSGQTATVPQVAVPTPKTYGLGRAGSVAFDYTRKVHAEFAAAHAADVLTGFDLPLPDGSSASLSLIPFDVFAPGAAGRIMKSGGVEERIVHEVALFSGYVRGHEGWIFLAAAPEQLNGYVSIDGEVFWISTGDPRVPGPAIVSSAAVVGVGLPDFCGTDTSDTGPSQADALQDLGGPQTAELILYNHRRSSVWVELDRRFRNRFATVNQAMNYGVTLFALSSEIFRRDVGLRLEFPDGYMRVWDVVPPWGDGGTSALTPFKTWWNSGSNPDRLTERLTVHLATTAGGGVAFLDVACQRGDSYGVSGVNGSFPTPVQHHSGGNWDPIVISHEMGHCAGSAHTFSYNPEIECSDGSGPDNGTIMSYCHLNSGGVNNVGLRFHSRVQNEIYGDVANASCVHLELFDRGDYDADGDRDAIDLAALDAVLAQGFSSRGARLAFDINNDGALNSVDRDILDGIVNDTSFTRYCSTLPNVSGQAARIDWDGTASLTTNDLTLSAAFLPPFNTGIFITGLDPEDSPLGNGNLCIGSSTLGFVVRYGGLASDSGGNVSFPLDHGAPPLPIAQVTAGATWYYQYWFRDPVNFGFNFSDALSITYVP